MRSPSMPSSGRNSEPPSSGIAVTSPCCVAVSPSSDREKRRERAEQHPGHEADVEIEQCRDERRRMSCAQESLHATCSSTAAHGHAPTHDHDAVIHANRIGLDAAFLLARRTLDAAVVEIDLPGMQRAHDRRCRSRCRRRADRPCAGSGCSVARKRSPRLKIAISRSPIRTARPSRAGMFSSAVTRIQRRLCSCEHLLHHA